MYKLFKHRSVSDVFRRCVKDVSEVLCLSNLRANRRGVRLFANGLKVHTQLYLGRPQQIFENVNPLLTLSFSKNLPPLCVISDSGISENRVNVGVFTMEIKFGMLVEFLMWPLQDNRNAVHACPFWSCSRFVLHPVRMYSRPLDVYLWACPPK